jgi:hypothetical protein
MPLNENGLTIKRFRELISDIQTNLDTGDTGIVITDEANKTANNIGNVFGLALAEAYESLEQLWNSFDPYSAEGVALDRIVAYRGITREGEQYSTGGVEFFGTTSVTVTPTTTLKDTRNRTLYCNETKVLGVDSVRSLIIPFTPTDTVNVGDTYYIVINGVQYVYTAQVGDTVLDVVNNMVTQISVDQDYDISSTGTELLLSKKSYINFTVTLHQIFSYSSYSTIVECKADVVGELDFPANTITTLVNPLTGITSVNNPLNFDVGSLQETDANLRERFFNTSGNFGKSTIDAIVRRVTDVSGVDAVFLLNNPEDEISPEGLPPKSFEVIVTGGDSQEIADTILANGPAGIESHGNISTSSKDSKGVSHTVRFSRPTNMHIFVNVDFEKYEEFDRFPLDGVAQIKNALVNNAVSYKAGQDVIPSTLAQPIYINVKGIGELSITCGFSEDPLATEPDTPLSFNRIPLTVSQVAIFDSSRITVNEVSIT